MNDHESEPLDPALLQATLAQPHDPAAHAPLARAVHRMLPLPADDLPAALSV